MAQVIRRNPDGTVRTIENVGGVAGKAGKLATLGAVISGDLKPGALTKQQRNKLGKINLDKLTYGKKDLAKLGLTKKDITAEDFGLIKDQITGMVADGKVKKPELKGLKEFVGDTVDARQVAILEEKAALDTAAISAEQRGRIASLNMSIFARQAVTRARGVRAAIGTTTRGATGFGQNVARVTLGGM